MNVINLYSAAGCIRCNIVKQYLQENNITYNEFDIRTEEGDSIFKVFYRENRKFIRRDRSGIFFPVYQDGNIIRQDAGATLAWLIAQGSLDHAIKPNNLGHGWIGGLDLSHPNTNIAYFTKIVKRLKRGGLKTAVKTNGNNGDLLKALITDDLIDRLEFELIGPKSFYEDQGIHVPLQDVEKTMQCVNKVPESIVVTRVKKTGEDGQTSYTKPEQIALAAQWLNEAGGSNKFPYYVGIAQNKGELPDAFDTSRLFTYRTAARRWQVLAEILND